MKTPTVARTVRPTIARGSSAELPPPELGVEVVTAGLELAGVEVAGVDPRLAPVLSDAPPPLLPVLLFAPALPPPPFPVLDELSAPVDGSVVCTGVESV